MLAQEEPPLCCDLCCIRRRRELGSGGGGRSVGLAGGPSRTRSIPSILIRSDLHHCVTDHHGTQSKHVGAAEKASAARELGQSKGQSKFYERGEGHGRQGKFI